MGARGRLWYLSTTMLSGMAGALLSAPAYAQNTQTPQNVPGLPVPGLPVPALPAVDGFNWNFDALAGSIAHLGIVGGAAAFTIPVGRQNGFQLDLHGGSLDGDGYGTAAGHLFWRDPNVGLLGFYGSFTRWNRYGGADVTQLSGEFEGYFGRWTLQGIAGVEFGNWVVASPGDITRSTSITPVPSVVGVPGTATTRTISNSGAVIYDIKTRFFDQINLKYYLTDNWDMYVGHRYLGGLHALALGTEFSLPLASGVMSSLFVEARIGEENFEGVWGGLKFYFGNSDKTRIRRHREDYVNKWDNLFSILNSRTQLPATSQSRTTVFCPFGPSPSTPGFCE